MSDIELMQKCLLLIADEIKRICEKNNIPYYIISGTLLGAVRHKGFIPWDDDFDIGILREDYDKFLNVCLRDLKEDFYLQHDFNENNYCFAFAKIQLLGTEIIEDFSKNVDVSHGIFVDVFPLDNIPDRIIRRRIFYFKNHILKNLIWIKCGYGTEEHKKKSSYKILNYFGKFYSLNKLKRRRKALIIKYNNAECEKRFISDYPYCIFKNRYFKIKTTYQFEDRSYMGFEDYDDFLSNVYGNYMKLPPEEKRVGHSKYKINFGKYYDN